jgi:adenylate cyclase
VDDGQHCTADSGPGAAYYELVGLDPPVLRRPDVAALTGIPHERTLRWWRALGFPEVPPDVYAFSHDDVEMVRRLSALSAAGLADDDTIHRLARLLGASFSRIADAQVTFIEHILAVLPDASESLTSRDRLVALVDASPEPVLAFFEDSVLYVWRRHLLAALGRRLAMDEVASEGVVGFADLSGFTRLSQRASADRLAELVDEFEEATVDVVSTHGGRTVKLIGDEILFVADSLPVAVDIGLDIADRLRQVPDMPAIHCGIATGPMITVGGDVFGPAVNLAARLTSVARPGTIVIPRDAVELLAGRDDIEIVPRRRGYPLRGIGDTRIAAVRRRVHPSIP